MILAGFSLFIIFLLVIGMPVAFTLSVAGILGIIQFVDVSFLSQVPVIAYKTLDSYVLTSVPLYILMSQIMLTGRVGSKLRTRQQVDGPPPRRPWHRDHLRLRHLCCNFRIFRRYRRHHRRYGHSGNAEARL